MHQGKSLRVFSVAENGATDDNKEEDGAAALKKQVAPVEEEEDIESPKTLSVRRITRVRACHMTHELTKNI